MRFAMTALLVRDYDEAIDWYTDKMGFRLKEDTRLSPEKRWVVVTPPEEGGGDLLLAKAKNDIQQARIGDQAGGRVFLFLHTKSFDEHYRSMKAKGVEFTETPREEDYGKVVVFRDLYGNLWDLVERRS